MHLPRPALRTLTAATTITVIALAGAAPAVATTGTPRADITATASPSRFPKTLPMPTGSVPEGIAIKGTQAYVTSLADGTVYRLDLRTGARTVLTPATGVGAVGIAFDTRGHLLVAGGAAGTLRVVDPRSGRVRTTYTLSTGATFINDIAVTDDAVYVTDSTAPVLYRLPLGPHDALPKTSNVQRISLTGIAYGAGFNANGITSTPDGKALLIVQTNTGTLYRVNPITGAATPFDLGGQSLTYGDGMLREGRILYVVRNIANSVTVIRLNPTGTTATVTGQLTDPRFDTPTTIARFGNRFYLPNARFTTTSPQTAEFTVVAIRP